MSDTPKFLAWRPFTERVSHCSIPCKAGGRLSLEAWVPCATVLEEDSGTFESVPPGSLTSTERGSTGLEGRRHLSCVGLGPRLKVGPTASARRGSCAGADLVLPHQWGEKWCSTSGLSTRWHDGQLRSGEDAGLWLAAGPATPSFGGQAHRCKPRHCGRWGQDRRTGPVWSVEMPGTSCADCLTLKIILN